MKKIISKKPHHSGYQGWEIETDDGKKWSVLNFADSMKNHPFPEGLYLGWEGWNGETGIRADSEELVIKRILES